MQSNSCRSRNNGTGNNIVSVKKRTNKKVYTGSNETNTSPKFNQILSSSTSVALTKAKISKLQNQQEVGNICRPMNATGSRLNTETMKIPYFL
jgi:hypothetical protein